MHRNFSLDKLITPAIQADIDAAIAKEQILMIIGPTAIGKSALAMAIAEKIGGEIISADAYQIYRHMNIGTAKPSIQDQHTIPHHLIDIRDPDEPYTLADFLTHTQTLIPQIKNRNNHPIICGGTGLYCRAFLYNYPLAAQSPKKEHTKEHTKNNNNETKTNQIQWNELNQIDPVEAQRIHPNNTKRLLRALAIYHQTGQIPSKAKGHHTPQRQDTCVIGLTGERHIIYDRINARVDQMIQDGLIDEVKRLKTYYPNIASATQSMHAIGYKEILCYLDQIAHHNIASPDHLTATIDTIKQNTRRFAKRQLTWFRKFDRVSWHTPPLFSQEPPAVIV